LCFINYGYTVYQDDCTMAGLTTSLAWWHIIMCSPASFFV